MKARGERVAMLDQIEGVKMIYKLSGGGGAGGEGGGEGLISVLSG